VLYPLQVFASGVIATLMLLLGFGYLATRAGEMAESVSLPYWMVSDSILQGMFT
jgi:hypothetical protein